MPMSVVYATVNGRMVQENRGGTITKYVADTLGSVIQTRNASGVQTSSTTYWPYGEVRTSTGTNPSPWGFVGTLGYFRDALSRLYIRARYYMANMGRWNTVDPLWPDEDAYAYSGTNPCSDVDPTGRRPCPRYAINACKLKCKIEMGGRCAKPRWECRMLEVYVCGKLVFFSFNCDCTCKKCKPCPPPAEVGRTDKVPPSTPHYIKPKYGIEGCCCGTHTHYYKWSQNPLNCKCFRTKTREECHSGFLPGKPCSACP